MEGLSLCTSFWKDTTIMEGLSLCTSFWKDSSNLYTILKGLYHSVQHSGRISPFWKDLRAQVLQCFQEVHFPDADCLLGLPACCQPASCLLGLPASRLHHAIHCAGQHRLHQVVLMCIIVYKYVNYNCRIIVSANIVKAFIILYVGYILSYLRSLFIMC